MSPRIAKANRRAYTVTVPPDLTEAMYEFMHREQFMTESKALAALVRIALSSTPMDAATATARVNAYNDSRSWIMKQISLALRDIQHTMETMK